MSEITFKEISLSDWRQFKDVDIQLHPTLTVLTGPNGTGKSTILSLLSRHFGYQRELLSTPKKNKKTGIISYSIGVFKQMLFGSSPSPEPSLPAAFRIGTLKYSNGTSTTINAPSQTGISYNIKIQDQQSVEGLHLDSHRPPNIYRKIDRYPANEPQQSQIQSEIKTEFVNYYKTGTVQRGTLHHIKTALIAMNIFGHGNPSMTANPNLLKLLKDFEAKLKIILPESLGFKEILINPPEVLLSTRSGDFILDSASGGIIKLFEITWEIFFFSQDKLNFVVTMDEPENHLHPSMQRTLLRDLLQAFPNAQFVVATHSPFVVSSVKDSNVYVLQYEELEGLIDRQEQSYQELSSGSKPNQDQSVQGLKGVRVNSVRLDAVNKAGTASEVLREALGVPTTIPDWAETRAHEIFREYQGKEVTDDILSELYDQMMEEGLVSRYPEAVEELTKK